MKILQFLITVFLITFSFNAFAQEDYDWQEDPQLLEVPAEHKDAPQVSLKHKMETVFKFNPDLEEYYIEHSIKHVNSDEAIEENNKVYLPIAASADVIKQKARVITPDGKVIEMKEDDIKEAEVEKVTLRYFALRGLEKGSQVETFFILRKKNMTVDGKMIRIQEDMPMYNTSFDLTAPKNLRFISKTYNGLESLVESIPEDDESDEEKSEKSEKGEENVYRLSQTWDYIEPLKSEENAFHTVHLKKLIYRIDKNIFDPRKDLVSYDVIGKSMFEAYDIQPDKKIAKKLDKLMKEIGIQNAKSETDKLFALENYLKLNYPIVNQRSPQLENIESILENKAANEAGSMKLFCAALNHLEIEHQIVLANDRSDDLFDKDFEAYSFLREYLLYFPNIDKYMAPTVLMSKLGNIPSMWTNNYGLFLKPIKVGEFKSVNAEVEFIKPLDYLGNKDEMYVDVTTTDGFKTLEIDYTKKSTGDFAQVLQPIYDFIDDDIKEELNESQIKFLSEDLDIKSMETENASFNDFGIKPFVFKSNFTTKSFIERAGKKMLFKMGELIGPQVEMYQEQERKLPVDTRFNRQFYRELTLTIPQGFKVGNLDALNINEVYEENGEIQAQFVSSYTFEDNIVKVTIDEYYNRIDWPVSLFEEYKRIINAAADFNKVVLYLEK